MTNKGLLSKKKLDSNEILIIDIKNLNERLSEMKELLNSISDTLTSLIPQEGETIQAKTKVLLDLLLIYKEEIKREIRSKQIAWGNTNNCSINNKDTVQKQWEHKVTLLIDILESYKGTLSEINSEIKAIGGKGKKDNVISKMVQIADNTVAKFNIKQAKPKKWWQCSKYYFLLLPLYQIKKFYEVYIHPYRWFLIAFVFMILVLITCLSIRENIILRSLCGF